MKVQNLIDILAALPPDMPVFVLNNNVYNDLTTGMVNMEADHILTKDEDVLTDVLVIDPRG